MIFETKNRIQLGALEALLVSAHKSYEKELSSYAFFKIKDPAISKDLVQSTFLKTWAYLIRKGKVELMRPFLYRILNNLIIDEYRKSKTTSLDILLDKGFEPATDESERMLNVSDGGKVKKMVDDLPEKYQKVLRMRYIQGLSIKEMAVITNQSKNTVAVQAHRGLEKLKLLYNAL
ncbi:MAG TPA: RNA polymerase sigma factor [Candidatus Paceibacterota bacterium]